MSRADKTLTAITWELTLDETDSRLRELKMTVLCASRPESEAQAQLGPFVRKHVAFVLSYRFSRHGELSPLAPPAEVAKILR